MGQSYKNVYFKDCPQVASGRLSLTLAFGKNDHDIFEAVRHLSSDTLRTALGYQSFVMLQENAQEHGKSINAFCLSILRRHLDSYGHSETSYLPGFEAINPISFDPIQATFNGGRHEPLHGWYPYLEGYSPAFVESVIGSYCPEARSIFDPFGGTGTTPLTAARLGKKAYFSEINPVLQFLTASKVVSLQLRDKERSALVADLLSLVDLFDQRLDEIRPNAHLRHTHKAAFGESIFFDKDIFKDVLRCRTLIDDMGCSDPVAAQFLTIAVLRSLIPASRLIRRGDVRFKNDKELARGRVELREEVRAALQMIAYDIESLSPIHQLPILLVENAKNLGWLPALSIDAVITSPPYLNGTNYFRNTKVELWFLRCLKRKEDLAQFRFGSMTAGINSVTVSKPIGKMPPCATSILKKLEANAYDVRIPRMVACFASEMHGMLQALARHMRRDGTIVIDIGDSAYAGVHVPTDRFITESLDAAGFSLRDEHTLRQRYSRSQMKLTQKAACIRKANPQGVPKTRPSPIKLGAWADAWAEFKDSLPHQQLGYAKRKLGASASFALFVSGENEAVACCAFNPYIHVPRR